MELMRILRAVISVLAAGGVIAVGGLFADIDRDQAREKAGAGGPGKKEGQLEPAQGKPGTRIGIGEHEAIHRQLEEEGERNLREIARLMEKIQNNLSQKETGDATQTDQQEVVRKIQELIDKLGKGCGKGG